MAVPTVTTDRRVLGAAALTIVCSSALFVSSLDVTVVNVALPVLRHKLGASSSELQWVIDAYTLTLASMLLLGGSIGDRVGRRVLFRVGLIVFGFGSLGCALSDSAHQLIAVQVLQAAGAAMLQPNALSTITTAITRPDLRARAIGVWAGVFGLAAASGPLIGGALIDTLGWRWIFLINLPVVAAALLASLRLPETRSTQPRPIDPPGLLLASLAVFGLTYLLIEGPHDGFTAAGPLTAGIGAVLAGVAFVTVERRREHPLFPVDLIHHRPFVAATSIAVLAFFILSGFLFTSSVYWQQTHHRSALGAGLAILPATLAIAVVSPLVGRLIPRLGARTLLTAAGIALSAAAAVLSVANTNSPYLLEGFGYLLLGVGFGFVNPPITNTAINGLPDRQAGVASALATTSRQLGNVLGVAVLASFATRHSAGPNTEDLRVCWLIALAAGLTITTLAATTPVARRPQ